MSGSIHSTLLHNGQQLGQDVGAESSMWGDRSSKVEGWDTYTWLPCVQRGLLEPADRSSQVSRSDTSRSADDGRGLSDRSERLSCVVPLTKKLSESGDERGRTRLW